MACPASMGNFHHESLAASPSLHPVASASSALSCKGPDGRDAREMWETVAVLAFSSLATRLRERLAGVIVLCPPIKPLPRTQSGRGRGRIGKTHQLPSRKRERDAPHREPAIICSVAPKSQGFAKCLPAASTRETRVPSPRPPGGRDVTPFGGPARHVASTSGRGGGREGLTRAMTVDPSTRAHPPVCRLINLMLAAGE